MTAVSIDAPNDVRDLALADEGKRRTEWAEHSMPVLRQIRERFQAWKGSKVTTLIVGAMQREALQLIAELALS